MGAVCIIFDSDDRQGRYSWTVTWQGEHEDESDMALYATPPSTRMVRPKIGRSEYGGFLMTYPPGRMFHVFEDPDFDDATTKAERLLYAAIDYSSERSIVYVAPKPPRAKLTALARRAGRQIVYLPLGQLSPATFANFAFFMCSTGAPSARMPTSTSALNVGFVPSVPPERAAMAHPRSGSKVGRARQIGVRRCTTPPRSQVVGFDPSIANASCERRVS